MSNNFKVDLNKQMCEVRKSIQDSAQTVSGVDKNASKKDEKCNGHRGKVQQGNYNSGK